MPKGTTTRRRFFHATGGAVAALITGEQVGARSLVDTGALEERAKYDVRNFGARGDGKALDTLAINRAIEAAAEAGGGTVIVPAGTYLCYSIRLKSNIQLYLAKGATIVAADAPAEKGSEGFDLPESNKPWEEYQDFGHNHWHNSLIWGEGLHDVSICGPGRIWGKGLSAGEGPGPVAERPGVANKAIGLKKCRNVLLRDFSILHGGHFGVLCTGLDNLTVDNLSIDTNRAGIDMDCCRNVRVSNCSINAPLDDAICLKSSYALGHPHVTEIVTITNCLVSGNFVEGTLLDATFQRYPASANFDRTGRIKFGTESNGGFKNITISNCVFDSCFGITILSEDGAVIEDVSISNLTMRDTFVSPIFIRLGSRMRGPAGAAIGAIRRINISNIVSSGSSSAICSIITGIPQHKIEDVKLSNIMIQHPGGGTKKDAAIRLEEKEKEYPEPSMFGPTPAHGLLIRHATGIEVSDFKVLTAATESRPCFVLEDVERVDFFNVKLGQESESPVFVLDEVKEFRAARCGAMADAYVQEANHKVL